MAIAHASMPTTVRIVKKFKKDSIPDFLTRQALSDAVSGSDAKEALPAFECMGLTTGGGVPTADMERMVSAYGRPGFKIHLWKIVRERYRAFGDLDLERTTTSSMLAKVQEHMSSFEAKSVMRFYLVAAVKAGVPISADLRKAAGRIQQDKYDDDDEEVETSPISTTRAEIPRDGRADVPGPEKTSVPSGGPRADWDALRCAEEVYGLYNAGGMPMGTKVAQLFFALVAELNRLGGKSD